MVFSFVLLMVGRAVREPHGAELTDTAVSENGNEADMAHRIVFPNVAVIIRTYSNNAGILAAVNRAVNCGIGLIIVVVKDEDPVYYGNTQALLAKCDRAHGDQIVILPMRVGYSWSNALNHGMEQVRRVNLFAAELGYPPIDFVLNASIEALYFSPDLEAMIQEMIRNDLLGAVGTSFQGKRSDGVPVNLGKSYVHPRNTLMLVRWAAFLAIGGFNPHCDQLGGQEDLDWLIRLETSGREWLRLDLNVVLIVGANYDQAAKERREMEAISAHLQEMRRSIANLETAMARMSRG